MSTGKKAMSLPTKRASRTFANIYDDHRPERIFEASVPVRGYCAGQSLLRQCAKKKCGYARAHFYAEGVCRRYADNPPFAARTLRHGPCGFRAVHVRSRLVPQRGFCRKNFFGREVAFG